jgi:hypothetical protein
MEKTGECPIGLIIETTFLQKRPLVNQIYKEDTFVEDELFDSFIQRLDPSRQTKDKTRNHNKRKTIKRKTIKIKK